MLRVNIMHRFIVFIFIICGLVIFKIVFSSYFVFGEIMIELPE